MSEATVARLLRDLRALVRGDDPPPPPSRRPRLRRFTTVAVAVCALLAALAFNVDISKNLGRPWFLSVVLAAVLALPLVLARPRPLLAWRIAWLTAVVTALLGVTDEIVGFAWHPFFVLIYLAVLYAVAVRHPRGVVLLVWVATLLLLVLFTSPGNLPGPVIAVTVLMFLGDQVRRRREAVNDLVAEEERSELEKARRAVLEERTRIARELHDVVAHHMSLIAVRAESAPYRLGAMPDETRQEFSGIGDTAREALTEMRRLLGVLRSEAPDLARTPQPGLDDLAELAAAAREAGVEVQLECAGLVSQAPPGVQLSAYRIVQEALSNAGRHAPGAPVRIEVHHTDRELIVAVVNGPSPVPPPTADPAETRHGLVGMRERAAMLGGELTAAPTPDGGFALRAALPLRGGT